jgi:hypothetical protein
VLPDASEMAEDGCFHTRCRITDNIAGEGANPAGNVPAPTQTNSLMVTVSVRLTGMAALLFAGLHIYVSTIPCK